MLYVGHIQSECIFLVAYIVFYITSDHCNDVYFVLDFKITNQEKMVLYEKSISCEYNCGDVFATSINS